MNLEISPLAEPLGAEIRGWDPSSPLSADEKSRLERALRRHLLLVFRGHPRPKDQELIALGRNFGELAPGANIFSDRARHPEILPVTNLLDEHGEPLGTASSAALRWHLDYSYLPRVGKETFLEAVEIPSAPCPTYFCDNYSALETLPVERVERLRGLRARHDVRGAIPREDQHLIDTAIQQKRARNKRSQRKPDPIPRSDHPVVMRHPDSGRETLYVSPGMTTEILEVDEQESRELLAELFEHQGRPEWTYVHQWKVGDLVLFDSLATLHARDRFAPESRRYMRQMSTLVPAAV